jgi:bifunctional UDP-N-acetylglucosamine pyrophosphorylase/glucosamine-1-phosphate N-acetyltransferase
MKAIILAAGEGKRMRPLTLETPKPMIRVLGKPLLQWIIEGLPSEITELILVLGYKGEQIKEYFGDNFAGRPVKYVWQEKPLGTGHALHLCKDLIGPGERFLYMMGDDLHSTKAIQALIRHGLGVLAYEHADPRPFGVLEVDAKNRVVGIEEKPAQPKTNLVAVGVYLFDSTFFDYPMPLSKRGEYEYIEPLQAMIKEKDVLVERTDFWHPIGQPHNLETAARILAGGKPIPNSYADTPVIILAGGKGTRLPVEEQDKPKCLVEIAGKPILSWQLDEIRKQGFRNITLSLGYKSEMVIDWLKKSGNQDVKCSVETEPLGTGGGLRLAAQGFKKPFVAFNCDDLADVNFLELIRHGCGDKFNVISGVSFNAAYTFDSLVCDEFKKVCEFKQRSPDVGEAVVNIGHYYLQPNIFDGMPDRFSNERDLFPKLAKEGRLVLHSHKGYWLTANNAEQIQGAREFFSKK